MVIIKNNLIPVEGYAALTTLFIVWVKKDKEWLMTEEKYNHEKIHVYQQMEIAVLTLLVVFLLCLFAGISWWWLLISLISPLILYVFEWFIRIITPPYNTAYKDISFEKEAKLNQKNKDYTKSRKWFSWINYV